MCVSIEPMWPALAVECLRDAASHLLQIARRVDDGGAGAPDRPGPGGVGRETGDEVDVELGYEVAQGSGVQLVRLEEMDQDPAGVGYLFDQRRALGRRQVVDLPERLSLRNQDQPGKAAVVHQQHAAEGEA